MTRTEWPAHTFAQALSRLPPAARRKYNALQAIIDDARALDVLTSEKLRAVDEAFGHAQARIGRLDPKFDADAIAEVNEEIQALQASIADLQAQRSRRSALRANCEQVLARIGPYLINELHIAEPHRGRGGLHPVEVKPQLKKGETVADAIRRVRAEITRLQGELGRVRTAPLPPDEIRAKLRDEVIRRGAAGRPQISIDTDVKIKWPDEVSFASPGGTLSAPSGTATNLACWLHGGEIIDALCSGIDDNAEGTIPSAERPAREAALEREILALEYVEEALITRGLQEGIEVHRRFNAHPLAILGLERAIDQEVLEAAE